MFEALETGKALSNEDFQTLRSQLRPALLAEQFKLRDQPYPALVLIGSMDGAGKGAAVHRINEWMDPRLIETSAFWMHSDEEESRPFFWRFWNTPHYCCYRVLLGFYLIRGREAGLWKQM